MKEVETKMGLLMGISLSFILSLVGLLSSGHFTIPDFLLSFCLSFLISMIIARIIPLRKISSSLLEKRGLKPGTLKYRLLDSLISDLLMSPFMTFVMVYAAWRKAVSHGARIPFAAMLLKSELISFIAAYLCIFLLSPLFLKLAFKGINNAENKG